MTSLNIPAGDSGGELDPHGADLVGFNSPRAKAKSLTLNYRRGILSEDLSSLAGSRPPMVQSRKSRTGVCTYCHDATAFLSVNLRETVSSVLVSSASKLAIIPSRPLTTARSMYLVEKFCHTSADSCFFSIYDLVRLKKAIYSS